MDRDCLLKYADADAAGHYRTRLHKVSGLMALSPRHSFSPAGMAVHNVNVLAAQTSWWALAAQCSRRPMLVLAFITVRWPSALLLTSPNTSHKTLKAAQHFNEPLCARTHSTQGR
jgi:hypothetical protein